MQDSRRLAGLLGPIIVAVTLSETELINPDLYDKQIPPVVYLSGCLFFIAGLAIVRIHNHWTTAWPVLITLVGWFAILLGLVRMFATRMYQVGAQDSTALLFPELALCAVGAFLTFKGYGRHTPK
jgi:hypothetical protein